MAEKLILVDRKDRIRGYEEKENCHDGKGKLHRAFSIFIFNSRGEMLIHRRASGKRLWPGYWTNSVCSHPRQGETYKDAAKRRLKEELGIATAIRPLFKFKYSAEFGGAGSENEMDVVFAGTYDGEPKADKGEIAEWKFASCRELTNDAKAHPEKYTPWFRMSAKRVIRKFYKNQESKK